MIAISYRREDSTPIAGRLHDRLRAEFGRENVFMDFDSIPYGVDFRDHIAQTLEGADILIAVIGSGWLGNNAGESKRRIDDATDFVRLEIAGALQRRIPVIPILVDKTPMPKEDALPDDLKPLVFRNALVLDTGIDFHHHADRLIAGIRSLLKNVQSGSRRGSKERSRGSPVSGPGPENTQGPAGWLKWLNLFDRSRPPLPASPQIQRPDAPPTVKAAVAAVPEKMSVTEKASRPKRASRPRKQPMQPQISSSEPVPPAATLVTALTKEQAIAPPPLPVATPPASIEKKAIRPAPPSTAKPAPSDQGIPIAPPSVGTMKPQDSTWSEKLLPLVAAGVVVTLVICFVLLSRTRLPSGRTKSAQPDVPLAQSSPLNVPEPSPSVSIAPQPSTLPLGSAAPLVVSSPSPAVEPSQQPAETTNTESVATGVAPSPSTAPASAPPSEEKIRPNYSVTPADEENVHRFVQDYYMALSRRDINAIVSMYADTVDYQGQGHHDRKYIKTDMANYFRRWDKIAFDGGDLNLSRNGEGSLVVSFNSPFAVSKGLAPAKRGLSAQTWILYQKPSGNLQIVSQREKVVADQPVGQTKRRKPR